MEADIFPLNNPELADVIDGSIGEESAFHERFGYYAQGVGPNKAILPRGWKNRLVKIQNKNTDLKIGYCLEVYDLAASKLMAFREKDLDFIKALIKHDIIEPSRLTERINKIDGFDEKKVAAIQFLNRQLKSLKP